MDTIWKAIPGWEDKYEISNTGLVKSLFKHSAESDVNGFIRPVFDKDCYLKLALCCGDVKEYWRVHQLVGIAFIPNPDNKPVLDHINGVRWDNRVENLRWVTQQENIIYSYYRRGVRVGSERSVLQIGANGEVIKKYANSVAAQADGFHPRSIRRVASGERKVHKGYGWKYEYND